MIHRHDEYDRRFADELRAWNEYHASGGIDGLIELLQQELGAEKIDDDEQEEK